MLRRAAAKPKCAPSGPGVVGDGRPFAALSSVVIPWYYHGMKVAVSIPDELFDSAESLGKKMGVSRSRLFATALAEFVAKHRGRKITEHLDAVYAAEDSRLDSRLRRVQARSIGERSW
jgi:hypothetical protein